MTAERVVLDRIPTKRDRLMWCEWLTHHGIDPDDVCVPGWIERREAERQVVWLAYSRDERGRVLLDDGRDDVQREVHVQQLEAHPSPFPE